MSDDIRNPVRGIPLQELDLTPYRSYAPNRPSKGACAAEALARAVLAMHKSLEELGVQKEGVS